MLHDNTIGVIVQINGNNRQKRFQHAGNATPVTMYGLCSATCAGDANSHPCHPAPLCKHWCKVTAPPPKRARFTPIQIHYPRLPKLTVAGSNPVTRPTSCRWNDSQMLRKAAIAYRGGYGHTPPTRIAVADRQGTALHEVDRLLSEPLPEVARIVERQVRGP